MTTPAFEIDPTLAGTVLALADDELVIGHRHSEWLGLSPFLEEDLAMASIAQDEFGHARALYALLWPSWKERDALVVGRPPDEWRSCAFVELDARPWERHLVRHVLYDVTEEHRWRNLARNGSAEIAAVANRVLVEERWHRRHALDLLGRLAPANGARLQRELDLLTPFLRALIDDLDGAEKLAVVADLVQVCEGVGLNLDDVAGPLLVRTHRSDAFADIYRSLSEVAAIDPSASW